MTTAGRLTAAVRAWLDALDPAQHERATFPFDADERFVWAYTPEPPRKGLAIRDMDAAQRARATAIVAAATSARAAGEIASIIALEPVLGALERAAGAMTWRRDPELYWFALFGEPAETDPWSWRIGGHHVAIHVTVADGQVIGATPSFLGANPAVVPSGPQAGTRTLSGEEDLARALLGALTPGEREVAIVAAVAPADILTGIGRHADVRLVPSGIRHGDLGRGGRTALERLVRFYLDRSPADVADVAWGRIVDAGLDDVTFAWSGPEVPGRGHYYAVRGPEFVIEYDNTQNDANHIHAVWRDLANDWGEDLLGRHLAAAHRG